MTKLMRHTLKLMATIVFTWTAVTVQAQKQTPKQYIDKFKDYAVIEMHRSGVPASITLAQGILESSSGNSRLAKYGNNHFGIKCKSDWTGSVMYASDDAPDECFRAYDGPIDSYKDHSDFLRKNWRYHPLFELEITDYKGWSRGLKKAGYATNPKYHIILINLIEKYELYQFDEAPLPSREPFAPHYSTKINDIPVMVAGEEDNVARIAAQNNLRERHIIKFNDMEQGSEIKQGDLVYLKPKRRKGTMAFHVVETGESMHQISQKYGIKLKHLYKKNRMENGTEAAEGEKLNMQSKRDPENAVKLTEKEPEWNESVKEKSFVNPTQEVLKKIAEGKTNPGPLNKKDVERPAFHVVQKNNNIYRIAEKYHVFEEDLLAWNNIDATKLRLGQKIYLSKEAAQAVKKAPIPKKQVEKAISIPPESKPNQNKKVVVPSTSERKYHVVASGETLYRIALKYKVKTDDIVKWNNLKGNTIQIGQRLIVSE